MKRQSFTLLASFIFMCLSAGAQDNMMALLQKESDSTAEKTLATFKSPKLVNLQSPETVKKGNLEFRITHLFGNIGSESGGGVHTLYGFDQSNDIRIGFTYGLSDRLNIGFSRFKRFENLTGEIKFRALEQTSEGSMPLSITLWSNAAYSPRVGDFEKSVHRMTFATQAVLARKFSSSLSFELVPSFVHQNLAPHGYENDIFSVGAGGRWKFTRSASIVVDYMYSILENDYIPHTVDTWEKGGVKFSFHITRNFTFGKSSWNK